MSKKVLVISASFRAHSNSEALADAFAEGARSAGQDVEKINLKGKKLGFCMGCLACQKTQSGHCVQQDDADEIAQRIKDADVLVLATPIYYYNISAQLKTVLDRANPLYPVDYRFRDVYLLSAAAEDEEDTPRRAIEDVEGWVECFPKARMAGTLFCGGVNDPGDVGGSSKLEDARRMGAEV